MNYARTCWNCVIGIFDMDIEFEIGDRIEHSENMGQFGIIKNIDQNLMGYEVYFIHWEDNYMKYQWTNRIKHFVCKEIANQFS